MSTRLRTDVRPPSPNEGSAPLAIRESSGIRRFRNYRSAERFDSWFSKRELVMEHPVSMQHVLDMELFGVFVNKGWPSVWNPPNEASGMLVHEFYSNACTKTWSITSWVRGTKVVVNEDVIRKVAGFSVAENLTLSMVPTMHSSDIATLLVGKHKTWDEFSASLKHEELSPKFRTLHRIVCSSVIPCRRPSTVTFERAIFMAEVSMGAIFNPATWIHQQMRNISLSNCVARDLGWVGLLHKIFESLGIKVDVLEEMVRVPSAIGCEAINEVVELDVADSEQDTKDEDNRPRSRVRGSGGNVGATVHHMIYELSCQQHDLDKKVTDLQAYMNRRMTAIQDQLAELLRRDKDDG